MPLVIRDDGFFKAMNFMSQLRERRVFQGEAALTFTVILSLLRSIKNPKYAETYLLSSVIRGVAIEVIKYMVTSDNYKSEAIREDIGISKNELNHQLLNAIHKKDLEPSQNLIEALKLSAYAYMSTTLNIRFEDETGLNNFPLLYSQSTDLISDLQIMGKTAYDQAVELTDNTIMNFAFDLVDLVTENSLKYA